MRNNLKFGDIIEMQSETGVWDDAVFVGYILGDSQGIEVSYKSEIIILSNPDEWREKTLELDADLYNKYSNPILNEREKTHGDFIEVSKLSQELKDLIIKDVMHDYIKEALEMICVKLARIVSGNHNEPDHWKDIAGYSELVVAILENNNGQN